MIYQFYSVHRWVLPILEGELLCEYVISPYFYQDANEMEADSHEKQAGIATAADRSPVAVEQLIRAL